MQASPSGPTAPPWEGAVQPHPDARRGRGAVSNAVSRYERATRETCDDGWDNLDAPPPPLRTTVQADSTRTVITRNQSPDLPFDRSINPYRGCEHGCSYCFARPTHAYLGLSPGLDFETRIFAKPDAAALLETELRARRYQCRPMAMGTNTDPYQPVERHYGITRDVLKVLARFHHPLSIVTKSALVMRDIDILAPMAARGLVRVGLSITTLDRHLARKMEPRASTPGRRLVALKALSEAGIPTMVMFAPVIPGLNDHELDAVLSAARAAGANAAGYVALRLPLEVKDLFREWLADAVPERAGRVMSLIRNMRGGKDYDPSWQSRMRGTGPIADTIRDRFRLARKRLGYAEHSPELDCSQFHIPHAPSPIPDQDRQMSLF
ncbi:MAG: PA0069 family radical SAM protein [Rhodospirillaceae bacterium]|nr:MAG: PA0069 family radical SAM protein [Rhodospirillaceae bacterium]